MMPVAIVCGGQATRLYPLTIGIPKSMVPICGKPFIDHQLTLLKNKGVMKVVLCTGKFESQISNYVNTGEKWGLDVWYSTDGFVPLGTGGAVKKALPLLPEKFIVMYGDSYLDTDWEYVLNQHACSTKKCLMTFYRGIDYGLEILDKEMLDDFPQQQFDLWRFYEHAESRHELTRITVHEPFYEVGSFDGIKKLEKHLCNKVT